MASEHRSGGSPPVGGARQSMAEMRIQALAAVSANPVRPRWMLTRFPVSMDEFARLNAASARPEQRGPLAGAAAVADTATADSDATSVPTVGLEAPEGQTIARQALAPAVRTAFEGLQQTAFRPPDCTIAVGPNDIVVAVNADVAGYVKSSGERRFRWQNTAVLFGPVLPSGTSLFDPRVAYDHYADRWLVIAVARRESVASSWILVAASRTGDPAGDYWVWALDGALDGASLSNNWADYPTLGFDTQAIYVTCNMFRFNGAFQYAKLRVLNKAEVYAGGKGDNHSIQWYDLWNMANPDGSVAFTIQPAVHFRGTGGNPTAYLVNSLWPRGQTLTLWSLDNPVAFWSGGSATLNGTAVDCLDYDLPPDAIQPGDVRLQTNDARLLSAVYQFTPDGDHRVWTCHTSRYTWSGDTQARSVVQWYEIDTSSKKVAQQNRFGAMGMHYFYPALQTNRARDAFVVFGRSGPSTYAELRQTGRRYADAPGRLQSSGLIQAGGASYSLGRWGDYFGICRDGGADAVVWMCGEYAAVGDNWGTWIASASYD